MHPYQTKQHHLQYTIPETSILNARQVAINKCQLCDANPSTKGTLIRRMANSCNLFREKA
ncbi:hypothetical protein A0J61_05463 [Choanephora cucurbitarum]|uniref:Uncharacterized protein n=1 Tax=Choanephora cucurbitarum TaxID=101091 RepID=A0A1C7NBM0_9FUNG|nr:hypothetical protein A0J61_05463 [Choanephora cucurbitarum]